MVDPEVREVETGHPANEVDSGAVRPRERFRERGDHLAIGSPVEAAETDVDGVDRPPADHLHDLVADLLQPQDVRDELAVTVRELQSGAGAEEVGRVEEPDVQDVALDPLACVQQTAKFAKPTVDGDAGDVLEGRRRRHLVGDRADPADPRRDVDRFAEAATTQERLEEPGRFVDLQSEVGDDVVLDLDVQRAFALDPRQGRHAEVDVLVGHGRPPDSTR